MWPYNITFFLSSSLQYGIVIDSGSSRSNVYLYEWPGEKENETGVVTEIQNCKVQGEPLSLQWLQFLYVKLLHVIEKKTCRGAGSKYPNWGKNQTKDLHPKKAPSNLDLTDLHQELSNHVHKTGQAWWRSVSDWNIAQQNCWELLIKCADFLSDSCPRI